MGATEHEFKKENMERAVMNFLLVLGVLLFLALTLFIFFPNLYSKEPEVKEGTETKVLTTIFDTLYKKKTDTAFYSSKIITSTTPVQATQTAPAYGTFKERLEASYVYFILVFGTLLLLLIFPRLIKFKITKDGVEGELSPEAKAKANAEAQEENSTLTDSVGKKQTETTVQLIQNNEEHETRNAFVEYDPQKGLWGGLPENNSRKVAASFKKNTGNDWIKITLTVTSTKPDKFPLTDYVMFHLHSTFPKPNVKIYVLNGVAEYSFYAWGAFTLGVETDFGENFLELDLSTLPEAPEPFKSR